MSAVPEQTLALFPGALGDLLCCWPALEGLRRRSSAALTVAARDAWFDVLPADRVTPMSIDRREISDLFSTGALSDASRRLFGKFARVESWTGHGDENFTRRLAEASRGAIAVHPFRALAPDEHASQYYARCLGVVPILEPFAVRPEAARWVDAFWQRHGLRTNTLVIHPGSGGRHKNWQGMAEVATAWRAGGGSVVAISGPAEDERRSDIPHDVALQCERLDRVAAVLARAPRYLGNDSGISHLAGVVGTRGVVAFGPTDPRAWRPLGDGLRVLHAPEACRRCGPDGWCIHRLSVRAVLDALRATPVAGSASEA